MRMRLSVSPVLAEGMAKTSPLASNLKGAGELYLELEYNTTAERKPYMMSAKANKEVHGVLKILPWMTMKGMCDAE